MTLYKHKENGKIITLDSYLDLSAKERLWYKYHTLITKVESKPQTVHHYYHTESKPQSNISDTLISGAIGYATGSAILGGLIGGDIVGGILGDLFEGDGLMD